MRVIPFVLAALFVLGIPAFAEGDPLAAARQKLLDGDFAGAASELTAALPAAGTDTDRALYLLGVAKLEAKDAAGAVASFDQLLARADAGWRTRAVFKRADALARQARWKEAAEIYTAEVSRLISPERKQEIASVYLTYADKAFAPTEPGKKPDFAAARTFYLKAAEIGLRGDKDPEVQVLISRCEIELGNPGAALPRLTELLARDAKGPLADQAAFYLGVAHLAVGSRAEARRRFQDLLVDFPQSAQAAEAAYKIALTFGMPAPVNDLDLDLGVKALQDFATRFSGHKLVTQAEYEISLAHVHRGRLPEAAAAIQSFLSRYPTEDKAKETPAAKQMLGEVLRRQRKFDEAIGTWQKFLTDHPAHALWNTVQRQILDTEFGIGVDLLANKKVEEARAAWTRFSDKYPLDGRNAAVLYTFGQSRFDAEKWDEAIADWERLVSKYPGTEESSNGLYMIAQVQELKLRKFDAALESYRKLTWGSRAASAQQRIAELSQKKLVLLTERTFLTREQPVVKLTSRNLEKVAVRVYRVNLETYFRRMHTIVGVENLDTALIEPDKTYDVAIKDFEKYRECETAIELPFTGAGTFVVNVSDEDFEATTLVVVSDLAMIAKGARNGVFAFVEDMNAKKPVEGATVLISDGKKVVHEGKTNADGVLQVNGEMLKDIEWPRLFVVGAGGSASNMLDLAAARFVTGLQPRGFVHTDRPAYRPGHEVKIRGILRTVDNGAYTFVKGETWKVDTLAPSGEAIAVRTVVLDEFGCFDTAVTLDAGTPVGEYRLVVRRPDGVTFAGGFRVAEYQIQKIHVDFTFDRSVLFRGEALTGKIKVAYYYGEPAAHKTVQYRIGSQPPVAATTDDKGEIAFSVSTRDFPESGAVECRAGVAEDGVLSAATFYLAAREFDLSLDTLRSVYVVGEDIVINVKGVSPAPDKTIESQVTVTVGRIGDDGTEVNVGTSNVALTKDIPSGKAVFRFDRGGRHIVRAAATDRMGNPVTATREIFLSGEEDKVKVRILSDATTFQAGESPEVTLVSRLEPTLALLTWEGETVMAYRLLQLAQGTQRQSIEMAARFAPNFALSLCVMDGNTLHEARSEFLVNRGLSIKLTTPAESYRPGEPVEVSLTATDPLGKPTRALLSLAMVDEALYGQFPDRLPNLNDFFYGQRRVIAVVTSSSNTFKYEGRTVPVLKELLEEGERLRREQEQVREYERKLEEYRSTLSDAGELRKVARAPRRQGDKSRAPSESAPGKYAETEEADGFEEEEFSAAKGDSDEILSVEKSVDGKSGVYDAIGVGGGGGGAFGGRKGGKRNLVARGGGGTAPGTSAARSRFPETAFWAPALVTGEDGKAIAKLTLPDSTTTWRFTSIGATVDTQVGKATHSIKTSKPFFLDLKAPRLLVEGDKGRLRVLIFNHTGAKQEVTLTLALSGALTRSESRTVSVENGRPAETDFEIVLPEGQPLANALQVMVSGKAGDATDELTRTIPIRPWGTELRTGTGGVAGADRTVTLALPARDYITTRMSIDLGPSLERSFLDLLDPPAIERKGYLGGANARGLIALEVAQYLEATGRASSGETHEALEAVAAGVSHLVVSQTESGGWSWSGQRGTPSPEASAEAVRLLSGARRRGVAVPEATLARGLNYLQATYQTATTNETKALLLWALAHEGKADFALINRLDRLRNGGDTMGLALLSLIWLRAERSEKAGEVAALLEQKGLFADVRRPERFEEPSCIWVDDRVEQVALAVLALELARPQSPLIESGIQWLLDHTAGRHGVSPKGQAATAAALGAWYAKVQRGDERYTLQVKVNDREVAALAIDGASRTRTVTVPPDALAKGENRVHFALQGRGTFTYAVVLSGFTRKVEKDQDDKYVQVRRFYEPATLTVDGKPIPRGFGTQSGQVTTWRNPLTQLAEGKSGIVTLELNPHRPEGYLVVEEPIPAGCAVLEESISGKFDAVEVRDGRLFFYLGENLRHTVLSYEVNGFLPGQYRASPTRVWSLYQPDRLSTGPEGGLTVIARGESSKDEYRMTPDELYGLGSEYFTRKEFAKAQPLLSKLLAEFKLREDVTREAARMLLFTSIATGDNAAIVKYFEVLKERYPDLVIPFADIVKIGQAYSAIGEFERALQVFRATGEASFVKEAKLAADLEAQGEFLASIDFLEKLLAQYPDGPETESARYALSQHLYSSASRAAALKDARERKLTGDDFIRRAVRQLEEFLTQNPANPNADEAAFSLANAFLDLGNQDESARLCGRFQKRFARSKFLDAFLYIEGLANFKLTRFDQARALLGRVATEKFPNEAGEAADSNNKWLAIYILGQIHHAMGQPGEAVVEYQKVADRFSDAREAIDQFTRKSLALPEVSTFKTGEACRVKLTFRNVPSVDFAVYKVDLMKLYLMRKNLNQITGINLSGIEPMHRSQVTLGEGKDYRDVDREVEFPVKDPGAYLVVAKGGDADASGMILVSNLKLQVVEDAQSGRVRVNLAADGTKSGERAHVKVIGEANDKFNGGYADLRGVFVASDVRGKSTVIVRLGNEYAFFRGEQVLQPALVAGRPAETPASGQTQAILEDLEKNLSSGNKAIQSKNELRLQELYNKKQEGVEVKGAR